MSTHSVQSLSTSSQRELVARVRRLVEQGSRAKDEIDAQFVEQTQECRDQFQAEQDQLTERFRQEIGSLESDYATRLRDRRLRYEKELDDLTAGELSKSDNAKRRHRKALNDAKYERYLARRACRRECESDRRAAIDSFQKRKRQYVEKRKSVQLLARHVGQFMDRRRCRYPHPHDTETRPVLKSPNHLDDFNAHVAAVHTSLQRLQQAPLSKFVDDGWGVLLFLFLLVVVLAPITVFLGWRPDWLVTGSLASLALSVGSYQMCLRLARRQTESAAAQLYASLDLARDAVKQARIEDRQNSKRRWKALHVSCQNKLGELDRQWQSTQDRLVQKHAAKQKEITESFAARREVASRQWDEAASALRAEYIPRIEKGNQDFETTLQRLRSRCKQELKRIEKTKQEKWHVLSSQWTQGMSNFAGPIDRMNEFCQERFPDLASANWTRDSQSKDQLPALCFGRYTVDLQRCAGGVPGDDRLHVPRTTFSIPAVLSFPEEPSLLLEATGEGRTVAVRAMRNVMLRLLTSLPPGKVRLTIIDPTGLGESFSAFMHLADFDKRLVTSRIWSEVTHINQRLADLTEHMENVIQKYLRNEFPSIQEYNEYAGEVAEPFHVLVIANFPTNFSEEAARRLVSIASSGPKCGVSTLISVDTNMKMPRNFDLADLEANANTLRWDGEVFRWQYEELQDYAVEFELPPEEQVVTQALRAVGESAKDANRVEVPFSSVAPADGEWWSKDSREEIEVPLGRVGATKLQSLHIGRGTSQHVLIAGKTGSGKSTLLHGIITNLALHYSPAEVQFYLIDFKKGVEFKPYAELGLPHARVIAIESEREFGMSVLERLDVELRRRGDLFRRSRVQSLAAYRDARPEETMPRVLLIIDEFQEFFVKDDRIAQNASLLLDRLVRQGRAFGIHVLLGSQTLAGTYTLARSTIGQMAVRIALQCSSADAHLILSEDNDAARLLHRPGEAIYNDANGLFEGNHPFQVVWLPDHEKESYLHRVKELAASRGMNSERQIVFEGNSPADANENQLLRTALQSPVSGETPLAPRAWLGEPIAITDPLAVVFHRRSSSNLLVVGQQEEAALGVLANGLISLAAFSPARPNLRTRFFVLDAARSDSPVSGFWKRLASSLPLDIKRVTPRRAVESLSEIVAEIDSRIRLDKDTEPAVIVVIHNLVRFRELKKSDDDFGFSSRSDEAARSPAAQLAKILREGPAVGVHTLMWVDTYNNATRWLDRQSFHDLDARVLFQMSAIDSSNLMDSPAASNLGTHRAILYSEEQGDVERFRPYRPPSAQWLARVRECLLRRAEDAASAESNDDRFETDRRRS